MPIFRLDERLAFPPPEMADDSGLLAVGGDLSSERLLLAYQQGIFPWYQDDMPICWHSPDPRLVLRASELHVPRSLQKKQRKNTYEVRLDTQFDAVIDACAKTPRSHEAGTWITEEMKVAYKELHRQGVAHSAEAWLDNKLVGGVYGISLGAAFFGESMFATAPDASKVAFVELVEQLLRWEIDLIDCQVHTEHLARFGAVEWPRDDFLLALAASRDANTRLGPWRLD